jgi:hypothetical protein
MLTVVFAALLAQTHFAAKHADVFGEEEAAAKAGREIDAAGERFRDLIGSAPLRGAIVLTVKGKPEKDNAKDLTYARFGAKWIWRWEPKCGAEPDETMTHELGHLWLAFWADGTQPPRVKQYGSTLPDWVDEGFANLLEGPKAHKAYRDEVRRRAAAQTLLPLASLLGCVHPDSREKTEKPREQDRWLFYAQSYGFTAFLVDRAGAAGFRKLAALLKAGKPFAECLEATGLPATLEALEAVWKQWAAETSK